MAPAATSMSNGAGGDDAPPAAAIGGLALAPAPSCSPSYARRSLPAKPGGSAFKAPPTMASLCTSTAEGGGTRAPATKICATIGPSSQDIGTLRAMLRSGMSLARINLTWGPLDFHRRTLLNLQQATRRESLLCGVIVGTSGREIPVIGRATARTASGWPNHTDTLEFKAGRRVVVTAREGAVASGEVLPISFKDFPALVSPGDLLHVGRYLTVGSTQGVSPDPSALLTLRVLSVSGLDVDCEALTSAALTGLLTISHPGGQQQQRQQAAAVAAACELQSGLAASGSGGGGGDEGATAAAAGIGSGNGNGGEGGGWPMGGGGQQGDAASDAATTASEAGTPAVGYAADGSANYCLPILADTDMAALKTLASAFPDMIDFVAVSYVRCAEDIVAARAALASVGLAGAGVAAEINTAAALGRFAKILDESDAIIINRGALGLEVPPEKLCPLQKALVLAANLVGKPVAVNMLVDSMVGAPRPTRAEATDVANAVLDGVDALQCGAETLRGAYPIEAVSTLARICREAELVFDHQHHYRFLIESATTAQEQREEGGEEGEGSGGGGVGPQLLSVMGVHGRGSGHAAARGARSGVGGRAAAAASAGRASAATAQTHAARRVRRSVSAGETRRAGGGAGPMGAAAARLGPLELAGTSDEGSDFDDSRVSSMAASPNLLMSPGGLSSDSGAPMHPSLLRWAPGTEVVGAAGSAGDAAAGISAQAPAAARPPRHPPAPGDGDRPAAPAHGGAWGGGGGGGGTVSTDGATNGGGAMHRRDGSFADISTALHSMARGLGPSRLSGSGAAAAGTGAAGRGSGGGAADANGPGGISPFDTPLGSPRAGWRGAAARGPLSRGPASLRARAAVAAAGGGAPPGGWQSEHGGRQTTLALDPARELYPRLEAMAASAVRTALKVGASLIVVLSHTSTAARLVSKYRPAQPVLVLMVPRLAVVNGIKWRLEGRGEARRCLMSRGLTPLLWVPHIGTAGGAALDSATAAALRMGLARPGDQVVCLERFSNSLGVHVVEAGLEVGPSAQGSPHGTRAARQPSLVQDFFQGTRPRNLPGIYVSQLVSSPSVITPSAVAAAIEMIKADAAAAAAAGGGGSSPGSGRTSDSGGAFAAAEAAAARTRGPAAAGSAFGAVASGAVGPLLGAASSALPGGGTYGSPQGVLASPSPPHVGGFVVPPSPVVGFQSSQLPIRGAGPVPPARSGAATGHMPPISEAHPAMPPGGAAPAIAAAAAGAVAPGTAAGGSDGAPGLGGAGAAALGGGLRSGVGVPLVPTLSSAVDDGVLLAALELLAPPTTLPSSPPAPAVAPAAVASGGSRAAGSQSGSADGSAARPAVQGAAAGSTPGLVRSLSDVQLQEKGGGGAAGGGPAEGRSGKGA